MASTTVMWKFQRKHAFILIVSKDRVTLVYWDHYQNRKNHNRNFGNHHKIRYCLCRWCLEMDWFLHHTTISVVHRCRSLKPADANQIKEVIVDGLGR